MILSIFDNFRIRFNVKIDHTLFAIPLLILTLSGKSQQNRIDSLWSVYRNSNEYEKRLDILGNISNVLLFRDLDSGYTVSQMYTQAAQKRGDQKRIALGYNKIGRYFAWTSQFDSALIYFNEGLEIAKRIKNNNILSSTYTNIGGVYYDQGDYLRTVDCWQKTMRIQEQERDTAGIARSHVNLGVVYSAIDDLEQALFHFQESYILEKTQNNPRGIAYALINISDIQLEQNNTFEALANKIKAKELFEKEEEFMRVGNATLSIAKIYAELNRDSLAMVYFKEADSLIKEFGNPLSITQLNNSFGKYLMSVDDFRGAEKQCLKAFNTATKIESKKLVMQACNCLYQVYDELNEPQKSLDYLKEYVELNKKLKGKEKIQEFTRKEMQYEFDKERAVAAAKQEKTDALNKAEKERKDTIITMVLIVLGAILFFSLLLFKRFQITKKQKNIIAEQKQVTEEQKSLVEEQHKDIMDSIQYAKKIQNAVLPSRSQLEAVFPKFFSLYLPKDVVSGDFYWLKQYGEITFFAVADCTGHGVPGAMVGVMCSNALTKSVLELKDPNPGKILNHTRHLIIEQLTQKENTINDGMDISLFAWNPLSKEIIFSGANNPLWIVRDKEYHQIRDKSFKIFENGYSDKVLIEIKGDKQPVGHYPIQQEFSNHTFRVQNGDRLVLITDGYADQFGGTTESSKVGKKFKSKNLKKLILSTSESTVEDQFQSLMEYHLKWRGPLEQLDDICIFGIQF